ncbi:HAD family hydrolase [Kitasatospora kifunensis]|uniref:Putative hydrolase of the HAD superfamily n=1 Tax=Kitasatospora kifunensis TaxID=58351 RepID=A0A7W7R540_KITKI|nr:HAD family hydrolase [Kitasatospora kifunensis]MBB4925597.1 putative hydrolase of the HAD superfamily [Kitasatospora kifunensis]
MPLLLLDLDNTLLPRDAAFQAWAEDFLGEFGLPPDDLGWLTVMDGGGYVPRSTVLGATRRRYGLDMSLESLLAHYRRGINSHIRCPRSHLRALRAARAAGWAIAIVSNGGTTAQLAKIRRTGLGSLIDAWVVSEEAGCAKPDPLIFEVAAQRCGIGLSTGWAADTWMIGDHGPADIAGAAAAGLRSVWLHCGRPWSERAYRPTHCASSLPEAVALALASGSAEAMNAQGTASVAEWGNGGRQRGGAKAGRGDEAKTVAGARQGSTGLTHGNGVRHGDGTGPSRGAVLTRLELLDKRGGTAPVSAGAGTAG